MWCRGKASSRVRAQLSPQDTYAVCCWSVNSFLPNEETPVLQHSPYYSDNQFIDIISKDTGLSILDMNICNAFTKFDELEIFFQRVNVSNPVSIICLNECWLSDQSDVSILYLPNYNMFYQVGKCPGHSHCSLITYVHDSFKSEKVHIDQITTGWEHLTVEVSHNTQNAKKYIISNMSTS